MGKAAKPRLFCCAHVAVSMGEATKLQSLLVLWRRCVYEGSCKTSFVLRRSRRCVYAGSCKTSVSACPLASPCLWGKLQNLWRRCVYGESCKASLVLLRSHRRVYGGSCKTSVSSRVSACPLASPCPWGSCKTSFVLLRPRRRVYGGSCQASLVLLCSRRRFYGGSCKTSVSACPLASPCLWGKLPSLASFAASSLCFSSTLCKLCSSFVVQSSTGTTL